MDAIGIVVVDGWVLVGIVLVIPLGQDVQEGINTATASIKKDIRTIKTFLITISTILRQDSVIQSKPILACLIQYKRQSVTCL